MGYEIDAVDTKDLVLVTGHSVKPLSNKEWTLRTGLGVGDVQPDTFEKDITVG